MIAAMVAPDDLSAFPGAPFDQAIVDSACASVRADAGWHIAPTVVETLTLDCDGGSYLLLPTLRVVSVEEVRDMTDEGTVLSGWRKTTAGMLYRARGFPSGFGAVEVDLTHGYDSCPGELLPVIAERCQLSGVNRTVSQEQSGQEMVAYAAQSGRRMPREVRRYQLPARP